MKFSEFNRSFLRDPILGKLLPMQLRRTYPRFSLENGELSLSFAGYPLERAENGLTAKAPRFFLRVSYPACKLLAFVRLPAAEGGELLLPQSTETIERLTTLCDRVLDECDAGADTLAETVCAYHEVLGGVLTEQQRDVLDRFCALMGDKAC